MSTGTTPATNSPVAGPAHSEAANENASPAGASPTTKKRPAPEAEAPALRGGDGGGKETEGAPAAGPSAAATPGGPEPLREPAGDGDSPSPTAKKLRPETDGAAPEEPEDDGEAEVVVDWAERHGLRAGDRLQVLWTVEESSAAAAASPDGESGSSETSRWWGATLEPWDGTSEDGSAIRTLDYDTFPPDFPDRSRESVVFTHLSDALLTYPDLEAMHFRREQEGTESGAATGDASDATAARDADDEIVDLGGAEPEHLLNAVVGRLLAKHADRWHSLLPAQQAAVAEAVAAQKARLADLLRERQRTKLVLTVGDVREVVAQAAAASQDPRSSTSP